MKNYFNCIKLFILLIPIISSAMGQALTCTVNERTWI